MKNSLVWIAILVAAVAMFIFPMEAVTPSSFSQSLVGLPEEGLQLVLFVVTAAVAYLLLQLGAALGLDLSGYVQPVVAIVAPILVTFIEKYLALIPPSLDNVVLTIIHLIVLLVGGSIGTLVAFNRLRKQQAKQLLA